MDPGGWIGLRRPGGRAWQHPDRRADERDLHEPVERLQPTSIDRHRAIVSIMEELEAVDWYDQRVDGHRRPGARRGARAQPRRGEGARGDDARVAAPPRPGARPAPAHLPVHRRLDPRDRGGGRARRRRRARPPATAPSASAACDGRRTADEPPAARPRADHRRGLGGDRRRGRPRAAPLPRRPQARRLLRPARLGRTRAVDLGRRRAARTTARPTASSAASRRVQPLVELRTPFTCRAPSSTPIDRGARDADLDPVVDAARRAALAEDRLGVPRLRRRPASRASPSVTPHEPVDRSPTTTPTTRATSPRPWRILQARRRRRPLRHRPRPALLHRRDRDHRARRLPGARAPAPDPRAARSCGPRPSTAPWCSASAAATSSWSVGQDLSIGYLDHDAEHGARSTSRRASPSRISSPRGRRAPRHVP